MIDNTLLIRDWLEWEEDYFYFIQVIQRRKENPELPINSKEIRSYSAFSLEEYDTICKSVKEICKLYNARGYIRLNRRNSKKVSLGCIKKLTDYILTGQDRCARKVYESVCGESNDEKKKTWLIDIDKDDKIYENYNVNNIHMHPYWMMITNLLEEAKKESIIRKIPTPNGFHLICQTFNKSKILELSIKKDSPTLLYIG